MSNTDGLVGLKPHTLVHSPLASSPISEITHPLPEAAAARVKGEQEETPDSARSFEPLMHGYVDTPRRPPNPGPLAPPPSYHRKFPFVARLRGRESGGDVGDAMRVRPEGQARWQWGTPSPPGTQSGEAELSGLTMLEPRKKSLLYLSRIDAEENHQPACTDGDPP